VNLRPIYGVTLLLQPSKRLNIVAWRRRKTRKRRRRKEETVGTGKHDHLPSIRHVTPDGEGASHNCCPTMTVVLAPFGDCRAVPSVTNIAAWWWLGRASEVEVVAA